MASDKRPYCAPAMREVIMEKIETSPNVPECFVLRVGMAALFCGSVKCVNELGQDVECRIELEQYSDGSEYVAIRLRWPRPSAPL